MTRGTGQSPNRDEFLSVLKEGIASEREVALKNTKVSSTCEGEKDAIASSDITEARFVTF